MRQSKSPVVDAILFGRYVVHACIRIPEPGDTTRTPASRYHIRFASRDSLPSSCPASIL